MDRKLDKRRMRRHSFILSLWVEEDSFSPNRPVWRVSLEDPYRSVRRGFKDLGELFRFLEAWTAGPEEVPIEE